MADNSVGGPATTVGIIVDVKLILEAGIVIVGLLLCVWTVVEGFPRRQLGRGRAEPVRGKVMVFFPLLQQQT